MAEVDQVASRADWLVLGGFMVAGVAKLATHELWRDELQAWAIADSSDGLRSLWRNSRYEVAPPLWHLLLFGLNCLTTDPRAMQVLHLALAAATVAVVLRWAPFPTWQRRLFALGYFPFFEYLNVSRGYALGLLGVVLACALATRPDPPWTGVGAALGMLALSSVHGLVVALVLAPALVLKGRPTWRSSLAGAGLFVAAVAVAVASSVPPNDYGFGPSRPSGMTEIFTRTKAAAGYVWAALAPLPPLRRQFWNANLFDPVGTGLLALLGVGLLVGVAWALARARAWASLWVWLVGATSLLFLSVFAYPGYLRHWGHLFLLLVAAAWLGAQHPNPQGIVVQAGRRRGRLVDRNRPLTLLFGVVLVAQAVAGVLASAGDFLLPFSMSEQAAGDVRRLGQAALVGDVDFSAAGVAVWLERPMQYPRAGRRGTFVVWNRRRECRFTPTACVTPAAMAAEAHRLAGEEGRAVLVATYPVDLPGLRLVGSRTGAIAPREDFWIYEVM